MYTFYCCRKDGSVPSFEAYELGSDEVAARQAAKLLDQHASCSHVIVYDGEREVMTETRAPDDPRRQAWQPPAEILNRPDADPGTRP